MFVKTLGINLFSKTVHRPLLRSRKTETGKMVDGVPENSNSILFLAGVYLLLYYVCSNDVDTPRKNNQVIVATQT